MKLLKYLIIMSFIFLSHPSLAGYWWETEIPDYLNPSQLKGIEVINDIPYGSDIRQKFDVYKPLKKVKNAPVIFLIHGGAWMSGDKLSFRTVVNKTNHWVNKGFIVVSMNYRLAPNVSISTQLKDVIQAINRAQSISNEWGGSENKFILIGHSSGAHLLMLLKKKDIIIEPKGIIGLDTAGFNIPEIMSQKHQKFYDIVFSDPKEWINLSPINVATNFNFFLVCSKNSTTWSYQAVEFSYKVIANGGRVEILNLKLNHNDVNEKLGIESEYTEQIDNFISKSLNM